MSEAEKGGVSDTSIAEREKELGYEIRAEDGIKVDGKKGLECLIPTAFSNTSETKLYRIFPAIILFRPVMVSPRICSVPTADFVGLRNLNAMGYMCTTGTKSQTSTGLSL